MSIVLQIEAPSLGLHTELNTQLTTTVKSLRTRFYGMTGFSQDSMKISINGKPVENEDTQLSEYVSSGKIVVEISGRSEFGDLSNVSEAKKFELDDDDYDKRKGTIRELKRKIGVPVKGEVKSDATIEEKPAGIEIGNRAEITLANGTTHRGTVKFIGIPTGMKRYLIGCQLDEPYGSNDGVYKGERFFTCDMKYGVFVGPQKVKVGNFPPIEDEEM